MHVGKLGQYAAVRFWKHEPDRVRSYDLQSRPWFEVQLFTRHVRLP
jgi:hypothetical protein